MAYITAENLKYRYPHTDKLALDGLSFSVEKGEFIGIIGENGAGKSTLCSALMGLVPHFYKGAYGGKVWIGESLVTDTPVSVLCREVGLVFQNPFNQLSGAADTVYGEIAFGLQNMGVPKEEIHERIKEALELLDISEYRDRNPFDLSGGQMQRVALASVLVMKPDILILDEPTSQLDPKGSEEVFCAVEKLTKSGITIIMAEQKIDKLAAYCHRIMLLHEGRLVDFDTPEKIFSRDDLENFGICPPVVTALFKEWGISKENGCYPITLEEALLLKEKAKENLVRNDELNRNFSQDGIFNTFSIKNLCFHYSHNTPIIQGLNMTLDYCSTAIIGQNGAGKTTLVKLLKGLLSPVGGNIFYMDEDISGKTVAMIAGKVGYVFQNPDDQIFKYHVLDEVMFGPLNIGMSKELAKERALEALETTGLSGKEHLNPYDLELSERKMVTIASVLAMDTDVIILDEPTIAQDFKGKERLKEIILDLRKNGKSVISILHDMDFVFDCFERVIVMSNGAVLADGKADMVFKNKAVLKQACLEQPQILKLYKELMQVKNSSVE